MRAILVEDGHVRYVEIDPNDISTFSEALKCRMFTSAGYVDQNHAAYVDDEGILNITEGTYSYIVDWYPSQPLVGNILITGFIPQTGDSDECSLAIEDIQRRIVEIGVFSRR